MAVEIDVRNAQVETEAIRFTNNLRLVKQGSSIAIVDNDGKEILTFNKNQFANFFAAIKVAENIW